jgi:small subunit ribosomal protein S20
MGPRLTGFAGAGIFFGLPRLASSVHQQRSTRFFASQSRPGSFFVPNIQSAKKDLRKSRAAAVRNRAQRSALRTAVKKAKVASSAADERLAAVSLLDRAARKGLIHRNTAARQKSKIAKLAKSA